MHKEPQELPDVDTLPGLILTLVALSGELPAPSAYRLPYADSYIELVIKRLKRDSLIRSYFRDGLRGLRLTAAAKDLLISNKPDRFRELFTGDTVTNAPKYSIIHRLRLHRMAEVLVTMFNVGVLVFPWEKPTLFSPTPPAGLSVLDQPTYYGSREVKEMGEQAVKIRGSRSTGVLLTDSPVPTTALPATRTAPLISCPRCFCRSSSLSWCAMPIRTVPAARCLFLSMCLVKSCAPAV